MKIYDYNFLGEKGREVKTLQVVFWKDADGCNNHINMDASGKTEAEKQIAFRALQPQKNTVFFVKPGGLERDDPSEPSTVKLTIYETKETARRKVV